MTINQQTEAAPAFEGFAIIEVMGHRRLAGMVREVEVFGAKMLRIETMELPERVEKDEYDRSERVYKAQPSVTQFYSGASLFSVTPATREACEAVAKSAQTCDWRPLSLPSKSGDDDDGDYEEDDGRPL